MMKVILADASGKTQEPSPLVTVEDFSSEITVSIDGHGCANLDAHFAPVICLEWENGEFRLTVYSDINDEEPTHTISLAGAREEARGRR